MRLAFFALLSLAAPPSMSRAQSTPAPALTALLNEVAANTGRYRQTIPSLSADEFLVSSGKGTLGLVHERVEAKALFRVTHTAPEAPLVESRQITEYNGKPLVQGKSLHFPILLKGAFGEGSSVYFAPAVQHCLAYTLSSAPQPQNAQRIDFKSLHEHETEPVCTHIRGVTAGYVLVDPATHQILHLEREVEHALALERHVGEFVGIDYAPLAVGKDTFWLPTRITATEANGRFRFVAEYSNYHRFTGSATIMPDVSVISDSPPH